MRGRPGAAKEPLLPASLRVRRRHGPSRVGRRDGARAGGGAGREGARAGAGVGGGRAAPAGAEERERRGGRKDQMGEDETLERCFCKYLPVWQHMTCLVGFGRLRGAFGTSDETLNRV